MVGVGSPTRGAVLRWDGNAASFRGNFCNAFTEVAHLTADAANVALYTGGDGQDRLAVTTVPIRTGGGGTGSGVGVWISPPLGTDGLTAGDADGWRQVWSPLQYDPDTIQGTVLKRSEIDRQIELYRSRDADERRIIAGLQPKRAEVILAGACIVGAIMDKLGKDSLTVSDRGLRYGVRAEAFG